jgi:hypothetical protein
MTIIGTTIRRNQCSQFVMQTHHTFRTTTTPMIRGMASVMIEDRVYDSQSCTYIYFFNDYSCACSQIPIHNHHFVVKDGFNSKGHYKVDLSLSL